jgi:23S rRNA pseudouridine955/2504/2580 synthase
MATASLISSWRVPASRLFLHAAALKFTHPNTGEVMRIEAPLDEQLKRCLKVLRG